MIELREHGAAIVLYEGEDQEVLEINNWNTSYHKTISITTKYGRACMSFNVDEFIALAEIFKQLKEHRK